MAKQRSSKRPFPSEHDLELIEQTRATIKEAKELLRNPTPDTFLGRQTHETFPKEEAGQLVQWLPVGGHCYEIMRDSLLRAELAIWKADSLTEKVEHSTLTANAVFMLDTEDVIGSWRNVAKSRGADEPIACVLAATGVRSEADQSG